MEEIMQKELQEVKTSEEIYKKFIELYSKNVNEYTEEKNGLTYLTWSYAWAEFKKIYPEANYEVMKDEKGLCYFGDEDIGYMVYTEVTAGGLTYEMWLPVMDGANKAMKKKPYNYTTRYGEKSVEAMTMFDVNKTVMRCLVKNLAMFGLGLYIYAGEDLPEDLQKYICNTCGNEVKPIMIKGQKKSAKDVYDGCGGMCYTCYKKNKGTEKEN